jgi:Tfp pilus assembly protein PilF
MQEASKKGPQTPGSQYRLGLAYMKAGDQKNARASFERALKLNPPSSEAEDVKRALATLKS